MLHDAKKCTYLTVLYFFSKEEGNAPLIFANQILFNIIVKLGPYSFLSTITEFMRKRKNTQAMRKQKCWQFDHAFLRSPAPSTIQLVVNHFFLLSTLYFGSTLLVMKIEHIPKLARKITSEKVKYYNNRSHQKTYILNSDRLDCHGLFLNVTLQATNSLSRQIECRNLKDK
jgi:hypothetical protein